MSGVRDGVCGIGIGLRQALAEELLASAVPEIRFVEVHPENYISRGGRFRNMLERAHARWPVLTHGLTLGVGALESAEPGYARTLRDFLREIEAPFHSEHLCFSSVGGVMLHDLLPLPFRRDAVDTAVARIRELRDTLELPIAIENVSFYAHSAPAEMSEIEFLLEVLEGADAKLLLDVNNVFVNAHNHGFDARAYLDRIPPERVVQMHIAGHRTRDDGLLIDTHGEAVHEEVYALFEHALRHVGPRPVLLERDQNIPAFAALVAEVQRLDTIYRRVTEAK